MAMISIHLLIP